MSTASYRIQVITYQSKKRHDGDRKNYNLIMPDGEKMMIEICDRILLGGKSDSLMEKIKNLVGKKYKIEKVF